MSVETYNIVQVTLSLIMIVLVAWYCFETRRLGISALEQTNISFEQTLLQSSPLFEIKQVGHEKQWFEFGIENLGSKVVIDEVMTIDGELEARGDVLDVEVTRRGKRNYFFVIDIPPQREITIRVFFTDLTGRRRWQDFECFRWGKTYKAFAEFVSEGPLPSELRSEKSRHQTDLFLRQKESWKRDREMEKLPKSFLQEFRRRLSTAFYVLKWGYLVGSNGWMEKRIAAAVQKRLTQLKSEDAKS